MPKTIQKIPHPRLIECALLIAFIFFSFSGSLKAQEWKKSLKTFYAAIYYQEDKDLFRFTKYTSTGFFSTPKTDESIDGMVNRVKEILDMHPNGLRFNIYIYKTHEEISAKFRAMGFLKDAPIAFYTHKRRAVHISLETINEKVLAHEIAHAVINAYFSAAPPLRMQEILAQYVDLHLWDE